MTSEDEIVLRTKNWIEKAVIGLNLCPFAKKVYIQQQIRYVISQAENLDELAAELEAELLHIASTPARVVDTTLLIVPEQLSDFADFNDFLEVADLLLQNLKLEEDFQVASFHPQFQFADSKPEDIENYTNRSPYPILHILREDSVTQAVDSVEDPDEIYKRNIETMRRLGLDGWEKMKI